jgi:predicted O-methyltransferase YrrM
MEDLRATAIEVDDYLVDSLHLEDEDLAAVLEASRAAGLPPIAVSAAHGVLLELLVQLSGAARVLEVGTLGGYSAIRLARATGPSGQVVTLERDPVHAAVARQSFARTGVVDQVDLREGIAAETLASMVSTGEPPFDLVFIDADKESNPTYLERALELSHPGTVIFVDNVVRDGAVIDASSGRGDVEGTREMFARLSADGRLRATAIQTLGAKGYDGFLLGVVVA